MVLVQPLETAVQCGTDLLKQQCSTVQCLCTALYFCLRTLEQGAECLLQDLETQSNVTYISEGEEDVDNDWQEVKTNLTQE